MPFSGKAIGLEVVAAGSVRSFLDDDYVQTCNYAQHPGALVALAARHGDFTVERFEAYSKRNGTLLWADDFTDLSGWTPGYGGEFWSVSAGLARVNNGSMPFLDNNSVLTRPMDGATYFVARGINGDFVASSDSWIMVVAFKVDPARRTDDEHLGGLGDDGYRLLAQPQTELPVFVNGFGCAFEPPGGWQVGTVGFS